MAGQNVHEANIPSRAARAPKKKGKPIKVMATRTGYYDHGRRRPGDVFICDEKDFSATWMQKVAPGTPERVSTSQDEIDRQHDELLATKAAAAGGEGI